MPATIANQPPQSRVRLHSQTVVALRAETAEGTAPGAAASAFVWVTAIATFPRTDTSPLFGGMNVSQ
jgi:hypothetical protein